MAFNYFGGKVSLLDNLYRHFPKHVHFVDVFGGSFAVTINKSMPSDIETANDINEDVINFFKVLREKKDELIEQLHFTPVARNEYNNCFYQKSESHDDVERARAFFVRCRQSFYGLGSQRQNKGWHLAKTKKYTSGWAETNSRWSNGIKNLDEIAHRLLTIQIECKPYQDLISSCDTSGTFFYCDPPYPHECRSGSRDYKYEFSIDDHHELASILKNIQGKAMISSFSNDLYEKELFADWTMVKFPKKKNKMQSSKIVQECIWMNYDVQDIEVNLFSEELQESN